MLDENPLGRARDPGQMALGELVRELVTDMKVLARKEVELARAELKENLTQDLRLAAGLALGAAFGLAAFVLLLVAGVFGLAHLMPAWLAALLGALFCAGVAALAAAAGWLSRAAPPLQRTRRTLQDDLRWARARLP
ncbi:MAG: phage holin family protein [Myxococcales bacterium]